MARASPRWWSRRALRALSRFELHPWIRQGMTGGILGILAAWLCAWAALWITG